MSRTSLPAIVLVDVQRGFDAPRLGPRNNPDAELNVARLLAAWRSERAPVYHVRHASESSEGLFPKGTEAFGFKPHALPTDGEPILEKQAHSAFIGTDLEARLRADGILSLVIAGLTTDHCCSTTAQGCISIT